MDVKLSNHVITLKKALESFYFGPALDLDLTFHWIALSQAADRGPLDTTKQGFWSSAFDGGPRARDYATGDRYVWEADGWHRWGDPHDLYSLYHAAIRYTEFPPPGPEQIWVTVPAEFGHPETAIKGPFVFDLIEPFRQALVKNALEQSKARRSGVWRSQSGERNKIVLRVPHR